MRFIALWTGKITYIILRLLGKQGATLPGLVAEKIYPNILDSSLKIGSGVGGQVAQQAFQGLQGRGRLAFSVVSEAHFYWLEAEGGGLLFVHEPRHDAGIEQGRFAVAGFAEEHDEFFEQNEVVQVFDVFEENLFHRSKCKDER